MKFIVNWLVFLGGSTRYPEVGIHSTGAIPWKELWYVPKSYQYATIFHWAKWCISKFFHEFFGVNVLNSPLVGAVMLNYRNNNLPMDCNNGGSGAISLWCTWAGWCLGYASVSKLKLVEHLNWLKFMSGRGSKIWLWWWSSFEQDPPALPYLTEKKRVTYDIPLQVSCVLYKHIVSLPKYISLSSKSKVYFSAPV